MPKKRKKKEIVVAATALRHREEELLKDTTGFETLEVFKTSAKIGRRLSNLMIAVGALLFLLSLYGILTSAQFLFSSPLFIGALGFLGAINIFCGLLLLAKE
ncbi:hypothetical protein GWO13_04055 [Candidatus Bathyarchaeota archaeon]|nr:hypothetical protein [Candidatus Bathyarchaeota archaeon]